MAAPFAHELGVFDPTFPGITLHFPNETVWRRSMQSAAFLYTLAAGDILGKDPTLTVPDVNPSSVMDHVLKNPDFGIPLTTEEKESLGLGIIEDDPENAVANLALASAYEHERRHFHDWLLSPYTAAINTMRSEVFANYSGLRWALRQGGTTVIPVPLTRWLRKSGAEQKALVRMWQSLLGKAVRIQLPDLTRPDVIEAIEAVARRYRSIGTLFEPIAGTQIDGAAIFEASALLVQIQSIHDHFGETASNLFTSTMAQLGPPSRYGWFMKTMAALGRQGEVLETDSLLAIATWCLLGNTTADQATAHPLIRFNHAVRCVDKLGWSKLKGATRDIFNELDRVSGGTPYGDLLEHSIELGGTIVEQLWNAANADSSTSNFLTGIAQEQQYLYELHVHMVRLLMDDPDGYCQGPGYLDRSLGRLPEPPFRQTFGRPFYSTKRLDLARFDKVQLFEKASTNDTVFVREIISRAPNGGVNLQIADNWQYLCGLVDTVFAEFNRDSPEIETEKERAKVDGIRYIEVID